MNVTPATIAAGAGYSLAVRADGSVLAWGTAMSGGSGTPLAGTAASVVSGVSDVKAVATGLAAAGFNKSLAVRSDGGVVGWGFTLAATPAAIADLGSVSQVQTCLESNVYGLRSDGTVWLRTNTGTSQLAGLSGIASIGSANTSNTCAIAAVGSDGSVSIVDNTQLSVVNNLPAIRQARCSFDPTGLSRYCLALATTGRIWAWGSNGSGQLGDGSTTGRTVPVELATPTGVTAIGAVAGTSFALTSTGAVYSWGGLTWLGRDAAQVVQTLSPAPVTGLPTVVELATGGHPLVRGSDGSVWAWGGTNTYGEMGTGTTSPAFLPVAATGISLN